MINHLMACLQEFEVKVVDLKAEEEEEEEEYKMIPLMDLYPIVDEDEAEKEAMLELAIAVDHFRFFYGHVWRVWDEDDEDEDEDWVGQHLAHRFELLKERRQLGLEAVNWLKFERLAQKYRTLKDEALDAAHDGDLDEPAALTLTLTLRHEMSDLRRRANILENAETRAAMVRMQQDSRRGQRVNEEGGLVNRRHVVFVDNRGRNADE